MMTENLLGTGAKARDMIGDFIGQKEGRSLDAATLDQMTSIVEKAVDTYRLMYN